MILTTATRYHDISCGHRVVGHEGKCALLHGHNYRIHFTIAAKQGLDSVGRVLDFSVIKSLLCEWLEENWDHKFLAWDDDPIVRALMPSCSPAPGGKADNLWVVMQGSIVWVPFNPTAENIAQYLLEVIGPRLLPTRCKLLSVMVDETRKCSASVSGDLS